METALIDPNKSYAELVGCLTRSQRLNLTFLLCGYSPQEARKKASVRQSTIEDWLVEPNFVMLREYILTNREKYRQDALALWANDLTIEARRLIQILMDKIDQWNELEKEDKMYVWRAVELLNKLKFGEKKEEKEGDSGSYDELIIKKHREFYE